MVKAMPFNKQYLRRRLIRWGLLKRKPVSSIQIELTNHCNYTCPQCPQSQWKNPTFSQVPFNRTKGIMDFDLFTKVVDQASQIANEINFSFFGEPMMIPEFTRYMNYLADRPTGLKIYMNTNLSFATKEIFQKLIDIRLTELRISIDAATRETYEIVRPGTYFVDLEGNSNTGDRFETICEKVEYWFGLSNHVPTKHVFTVQSRNIHELASYVNRWSPILGKDDVILTKTILTYGGKIKDDFILAHPCNVWDLDMLTIDWRGKVSPCNLDTNMDLAIGSFPEQSLVDLFYSQKKKQIQFLSEKKEIIPCKTCVDANNWTRNLVFKKGDRWKREYFEIYSN